MTGYWQGTGAPVCVVPPGVQEDSCHYPSPPAGAGLAGAACQWLHGLVLFGPILCFSVGFLLLPIFLVRACPQGSLGIWFYSADHHWSVAQHEQSMEMGKDRGFVGSE